jgi:hypothetical protein
MNPGFWFWGFCTVCEVNFPTTLREMLWVPKCRQKIHLAKTPKPKINFQDIYLSGESLSFHYNTPLLNAQPFF